MGKKYRPQPKCRKKETGAHGKNFDQLFLIWRFFSSTGKNGEKLGPVLKRRSLTGQGWYDISKIVHRYYIDDKSEASINISILKNAKHSA